MRLIWLAVILFGMARAEAAYWHADFGQAQAKAYAENRLMLVLFTSSDNCRDCARLQEEVLSTFEFQTFADRHLILVEVDFPRWKPMHPTHRKINRDLADKYDAHGRPAMVLLNGRGEMVGRMRYLRTGAATYIAEIEKVMELRRRAAATPPPDEPPPFNGAPTKPAPRYKELTLKSISGTGSKRLALINNQTLAAGESAKVRLGSSEVKVRCEEIGDKSVIVTVDGKPERRELRLRQ